MRTPMIETSSLLHEVAPAPQAIGAKANGATSSSKSPKSPALAALGNNGKPTCRVDIHVGGMTCSACSSAVERALQSTPGVQEASVNLLQEKATALFEEGRTTSQYLCDMIEDIGFEAKLLEQVSCRNVTSTKVSGPDTSVYRAEISISGMTCSACSSAVQRCLKGHKGVKEASINLMQEKAVVTFDTMKVSASALCEEIEDIGFGAELVQQNPVRSSESSQQGDREPSISEHATLNLQIQTADGKKAGNANELLKNTHGVIGVIDSAGLTRVTYRPEAVGARKICDILKEAGLRAECSQDGGRGARNSVDPTLFRDFRCAVFPTVVVFIVATVGPSVHGVNRWLHSQTIPGLHCQTVLLFLLSTPVQYICGRRFHVNAYRAMKHLAPNMDVLISLATNLAYTYSLFLMIFAIAAANQGADCAQPPPHFFETPSVLITVTLLGKCLEGKAKQQTVAALDKLLQSAPQKARLVSGTNVEEIPIELVELGDELRVFPGEAVPVDGELLPGTRKGDSASFDESLLTGEATPITKSCGDLVIGGSRCVSGECTLRATRIGSGTTLSQILQLVEQAQASRAPVQQVADAIARVFVPSCICLALVTWVVWLFLVLEGIVHPPRTHLEGPNYKTAECVLFAMKFGLAVMLVACPCAMGLATPTAVMVSTGVAARHGILAKSILALEQGARAGAVVLDKTGTLTVGKPQVSAVAVCACQAGDGSAMLEAAVRKAFGGRDMAKLVKECKVPVHWLGSATPSQPLLVGLSWVLAAAESLSEHPLARGLEEFAQEHLGPVVLEELMSSGSPEDFTSVASHGVQCKLCGIDVEVGSPWWILGNRNECSDSTCSAARISPEYIKSWVKEQQCTGATCVAVRVGGGGIAALALQDELAPNARHVVSELQKNRLDVWMCTGDNEATANSVAQDVGITKVLAGALPADKVRCIERLQNQKLIVCMVGDGLNDSPALAKADIGIAIGTGAQLTADAADVILVKSDLRDLLTFLSLSKKTIWCIRRNFFWAFIFNFCTLPLAAGVCWPRVVIPPTVAGIAMACSSLIVICSSLALKLFRPPHSRTREVRTMDRTRLPLNRVAENGTEVVELGDSV